MQVSKKAILDQIEFHVSSYLRAYLSVGSVYYEYKSASAYVHSLRMLFSHSKAITSACDAAAEQLDNIFLNGDVNDYSRRHAVEQPDLSSKSEPVVQGHDFEETLTELDFEPVADSDVQALPDPLKQVDWTEQLPALPVSRPSSVYQFPTKLSKRVVHRHRWSMFWRMKKARVIHRVPQISGDFNPWFRRPLVRS